MRGREAGDFTEGLQTTSGFHGRLMTYESSIDVGGSSLFRICERRRRKIYCNNNFDSEPVNFASKWVEVAFNIPTFINLHAYGYENVFELKPLVDVKTTKIPMEGSTVNW
jgi:hypothetical protein